MTKFLAALLSVCALSAVAFAQKSSGPSGQAQTPTPINHTMLPTVGNGIPSADRPAYSHSQTGKLLMTNSADRSMVFKSDNAPAVKIIIDEKTKKTADKKTELDGRKDLTFTDYQAGQTVKVTFRASDNKVLEIRLKPTPK